MKKILSLILFSFLLSGCFAPVKVNAQNSFDKWFCQSLKMNAILTSTGVARNTVILNTAGAGIYGTDTTLFIAIPDQHKNSWWSVYAAATRIGTGTQSYVILKASMDGVNTFDLPGDTAVKMSKGYGGFNAYKISSATTSYYKFFIATSNSTYMFGPFEGFPYPYAALYIYKGNDSTTFSSKIYFTPPRK